MKGQTIAIVAAIAIALYFVFSKSSSVTPIGGVVAQPSGLGNLIPFESSLAQSFGALGAALKPNSPASNPANVTGTNFAAPASPLPPGVTPLPQGALDPGDIVPGYALLPSGQVVGTTAGTGAIYGPALTDTGFAGGSPLHPSPSGNGGSLPFGPSPNLSSLSPGPPLDSVTPVIPINTDSSPFFTDF